MTKTPFFSFIFPIPVLYLTAKFQHCSMHQSKVRAEKRATHARPCCDPTLVWHLRCKEIWLLPEEISSISSWKICIFSLLNIYLKFTVFYHWSDRQNALKHGLLPSSTCRVAIWKFWPGVGVFVVRPDQEEIGIFVALEIGVQRGIKGESERFVVFTRMNLFLEEM